MLQQGTSASGNTEITGTVTPQGVVLRDASGNRYALAGAAWFGETFNAQTGGSEMTDTGVPRERTRALSVQYNHAPPRSKYTQYGHPSCMLYSGSRNRAWRSGRVSARR